VRSGIWLKLGAGPKLLKLLDEGTPGAQEQAAVAIRKLAANEDNQVTLMKLEAAPKLLKLLDEGTPGAKEQAAGAAGNLAVNEDNKVALMKPLSLLAIASRRLLWPHQFP
jgi:hypothetical protein